MECISDLPNKKCEGFDRIPVCMLRDCDNILLDPLCAFFSNIYATGLLPEEWKVSKIIPIFKKGNIFYSSLERRTLNCVVDSNINAATNS